jgi:hypothetical protein
MRKILLLCFIFTVFFITCNDGNPPVYQKILNIPYCAQEQYNYCAAACIQMWAQYDGQNYSQSEIASSIGAPSSPYSVANAVSFYTNSDGWLEPVVLDTSVTQNECISYSIASIVDCCPSIIPFNDGEHAVIARGYDWHEEGFTPVADILYYHDPNPAMGGYLDLPANELKQYYFTRSNGYYYVIVGFRTHVSSGSIGYTAFREAGGTYYGAPNDPDPTVNEY